VYATIRVNADTRLGRINPLLYGTMFENAGRCIYDALWVGEDSATPNWRGFRSGMLDLLRRLGPTIIRWPGGTPSEGYHWYHGVGPRDKRPTSLLPACFSSPAETHALGTDEYIALSRELQFEPYICANVGTGTPEEAANWVEYCNRDTKTQFAQMRVANGYTKPFGVKYWGIGNESYFWYNAESYAQLVKQYSRAIRIVDPAAKLVAAGVDSAVRIVAAGLAGNDQWNRTLLEVAGDAFDLLSIHLFYGNRSPKTDQPMSHEDRLANAFTAERTMRDTQELIRQTTGSDRIHIAMDEWQIWNSEATEANGGVQFHSVLDGLCIAGILHMAHRCCDFIDIGIMANLVNSTCAVVTDGDRICLSPGYHALELYANHTGRILLESQVNTPSFTNAFCDDPVPYLDCSATYDEDRQRVCIAAINRNCESDIDCRINLAGCHGLPDAIAYQIHDADADAANDFDNPDRVVTTQRAINLTGRSCDYRFPANSITVLEVPTKP